MQFVPKNPGDLHTALSRLPNDMPVHAGPDTGISVTVVGDLRRLLTWPGNLMVTVPPGNDPGSAVKISRAVPTQSSSKRVNN